jgi:hypothetical protein
MKKIFLFLVTFLFISVGRSQYGFGGGLSYLKGFGVTKPYIGFSLFGEFARDYESSIYVRASFYGKNRLNATGTDIVYLEALDPLDYSIKFTETIDYVNYTTIDGGIRYYIIDGYDSGFALYGGSNIIAILNQTKRTVGDFDQTKYKLPSSSPLNGSVINLGFGFTGGAKYTIPAVGTLFLDLSLDYLVAGIASNETAQTIANQFYTPLIFGLSLGFRKDFY